MLRKQLFYTICIQKLCDKIIFFLCSVKQTCERYQPRKKPSSPVSNGNEGRQMNLSSVGNALKRELETTENIRDHMKKQKLNEPTPANEKMG